MEERVERRLAAILCADVVEYSRLMGADEEKTLAVDGRHEVPDADLPQPFRSGGSDLDPVGGRDIKAVRREIVLDCLPHRTCDVRSADEEFAGQFPHGDLGWTGGLADTPGHLQARGIVTAVGVADSDDEDHAGPAACCVSRTSRKCVAQEMHGS